MGDENNNRKNSGRGKEITQRKQESRRERKNQLNKMLIFSTDRCPSRRRKTLLIFLNMSFINCIKKCNEIYFFTRFILWKFD